MFRLFHKSVVQQHIPTKIYILRRNFQSTPVKMVQGVQIIDGVIQNINPATGALIAPPVTATTPSELVDVISKANAAQESWSDLSLDERIVLLRKGLGAVEPIAKELAETITMEMGKVPSEAKLEVDNAVALKGAWLNLVKEANEDVKLGDGKAESVIVRDPLGVVVVISPWNVSAVHYIGIVSHGLIWPSHVHILLPISSIK